MLVYHSVAAGYGVFAFGYGYCLSLLVGIEHYDDVFPRVDTFKVLQSECYKTIVGSNKLQMLSHGFCLAKAECGMIITKLYQATIILKHLRILLQIVPVELVDAVG